MGRPHDLRNMCKPPTKAYFSPINSLVGHEQCKLTSLSPFTSYLNIRHTYSHAGGGSQGPTPAQSLNVVSSYFLFQVKNKLGAISTPHYSFDHHRRLGRAIICTINYQMVVGF